jgi:hypothetical protein
MAVFKSLRTKSKEYAFEFGGNASLEDPAKAVFARFPAPDETFLKKNFDSSYRDVDWEKLGKKDEKEIEKLFAAFFSSYISEAMGAQIQFNKIDAEAFLRECVDHFESLYAENEAGKKTKIKTVEQFLTLPYEAVYEIAKDLYAYARQKDDFTLGESKA